MPVFALLPTIINSRVSLESAEYIPMHFYHSLKTIFLVTIHFIAIIIPLKPLFSFAFPYMAQNLIRHESQSRAIYQARVNGEVCVDLEGKSPQTEMDCTLC